MACLVKNNKLIKSCKDKASICLSNNCHKVGKILSSPKNAYGDVHAIHDKDFVVKVNKVKITEHAFDKEINIQKHLSIRGLGPKIIQHYSTNSGKYFIIMENLLKQGYNSWHSAFINKTVPKNAILALYKAIRAMHDAGISHNDLHANNIFYNKNTDRVKFIDFGLSIDHGSRSLAIINESWDKINKLTKYKGPWSVINNKVIELYKTPDVKIFIPVIMYYEYYNGNMTKINNGIRGLVDYFDNNKNALIKLMHVYNNCRNLILHNKKVELRIYIEKNKTEVDFLNMCSKVDSILNKVQIIVYQNK